MIDEFSRERRARLRELQKRYESEPTQWREGARFLAEIGLWSLAAVAGGVVFAWILGTALDWLERVALR